MEQNKKLPIGLAFVFLLGSALSACSSAGGGTVTIYVDGGGDNGNYNTTPSMVKTASNPFPYNTLQTVCNEWAEKHPGYKVQVNMTSNNGDRSVLLPQLKQGTAPHIIYQNGTVVNTDLGQDYYVDLTDYLNSPDPYLENNANWRTVYDEVELASCAANDGHFYYANLEKVPVCFIVNKTLCEAAGYEHPENIATYGELLKAMDAVTKYASAQNNNSIRAYATSYTWYQINMESNLFSDLLPQADVLLVNKSVDTEEFCRIYTKGIWNPGAGVTKDGDHYVYDTTVENKYYEYMSLINQLDEYKVKDNYDRDANFIQGNLAFVEATGKIMRTYSGNSNINFDWVTIPFPAITTADSKYAATPCVRGSAGLATSYWISKRAKKDGSVDACVDLLEYLTSPAINNRVVGDLGGGLPLNPESGYEPASYLKNLFNLYAADMQEFNAGTRVAFNSFASRDKLGTEFSNLFIRTMEEVDAGTKTLIDALGTISQQVKNTVKGYTLDYEYDTSKW